MTAPSATAVPRLSAACAIPMLMGSLHDQPPSHLAVRATLRCLAGALLLDLYGCVLDVQPLPQPCVDRGKRSAVHCAGREIRMQRHGRTLPGHGPDVDVMDPDETWHVTAELSLDVRDVEPRRHALEQHVRRLARDRPAR